MCLIVKEMASQIMFIVKERPLVFVDTAAIHQYMMGFVLHCGNYKAFKAVT